MAVVTTTFSFFFVFLFELFFLVELRISPLLDWRPTCVWSDSIRGRHVETTDRSGGEVHIWSCCWGLHSILTRFHFFPKDETFSRFYIYSISAAFFKKLYLQSLYLMCPLTVWDYTYYIISRGLWIIKI